MIIIILLLRFSNYFATAQPLLFPHGWMDSRNLRPRDAIYLNLMAQSNVEYGGVTIEELDRLDRVRKIIPRPLNLTRDREEDDKELDTNPAEINTNEKSATSQNTQKVKRSPFDKVKLRSSKERAETQLPNTEDNQVDENPFEEIATRSPPRDYHYVQKLRKSHRNRRRHRKRHRSHGFLTREDIIKTKKNSKEEEEVSVKLTDRTKEKEEFMFNENINAEKTWEREMKATEKVVQEMSNDPPPSTETPINPIQHLIDQENAPLDRNPPVARKIGSLNIQRLPNNPYRNVDIRKPTVLTLPVPPPDFLTRMYLS